MRLPFRDVIPSRTPPRLSLVLPVALLLFELTRDATGLSAWALVPALLVSVICLVGLGETLEDQFGRRRLLGLTTLAGLCLLLRASPGPLATTTGAWIGAYLALFPQSKLLVWGGTQVLEVPVLVVSACWALATITAWPPADWPIAALALLCGMATARLLRPRGRGEWAHFDHAPDR